ncbi:MAG: cytochrome c biogenesis protein CcdA, partial [Caldimonas sp.]
MALVLLAFAAVAGTFPVAHAADDFLPPEQAFRFSARPHDARSVAVTFAIAPNYYLYREQFKFVAKGATLGTPVIPPGKVKYDETFQKDVETYRNAMTIVVPVEQAGAEFRLLVTSQGCADAGLCYPPMESAAAISLTGFGGAGSARVEPPAGTAPASTSAATTASGGESSAVDAALRGGAFWPIVGAFFIAGVLLSLTPCVLPMLPIVSSIIVGQAGTPSKPAFAGAGGNVSAAAVPRGGVSRRRGFALAASYSFGMAIVYTAFGVAAGLAGEGLAAALQNPWVLGAFALGLVALSLSMFGVSNLQLPHALAGRVASA